MGDTFAALSFQAGLQIHIGGKPMTMKVVEIQSDGTDMFVVVDGVKIARRGRPDTPQAKTWVSLEPGWAARDVGYPPNEIEIEHNGVRVH